MDETHATGPRSDETPQTVTVDLDALARIPATAYPECACTLNLRSWNAGHGTTTTARNPLCPKHGDDAA